MTRHGCRRRVNRNCALEKDAAVHISPPHPLRRSLMRKAYIYLLYSRFASANTCRFPLGPLSGKFSEAQ